MYLKLNLRLRKKHKDKIGVQKFFKKSKFDVFYVLKSWSFHK